MPYVDELIAQNERVCETFNSGAETLAPMSKETAQAMFPETKFGESENVVYFPFKLCHTLPTVNKRGRAFTPSVLQKSFASLNDQLVDWDHLIQANNTTNSDRIIGHVKATRFTMPEWWDNANSGFSMSMANSGSVSATPVYGLAALFLRAHGVREAVENHLSGKEEWKTSMECGHYYKEAEFLYDGEFIPVPDAELGMRDCVRSNSVANYKGKPLALCLGGRSGSVNFWGVGITKSPADVGSDILGFVGGAVKEVASTKTFFMPLRESIFKSAEVANSDVDNLIHEATIKELASISVIGETEQAPDGHKHMILSDLTILESGGHTHHIRTPIISRGSNPTLTGHTTDHTVWLPVSSGNYDGRENYTSHSHLVNLPLKGKYSQDDELANLPPELKGTEMSKTLEQLTASLSTLLEKLDGSGSNDALKSEIASLQGELNEMKTSTLLEQEKEKYLQSKIEAGEILTAEKANELVEAKVKEETDKLKQQQEEEEARRLKIQERIEKCSEAKINIDAVLVEASGEEKAVTLKDRIQQIPTDEDGEKAFTVDFSIWQKAFPVETPAAEAANDGKGKGKMKPAVLAGGGGGTSKDTPAGENANKDEENKDIPKHMLGKRAFARS